MDTLLPRDKIGIYFSVSMCPCFGFSFYILALLVGDAGTV